MVAASGFALYTSYLRGKDVSQVMDRYGYFTLAPGTPGGVASDGTNFLIAQRADDGRITGTLVSSGIPAVLQTFNLGLTGGVPRVAFDGASYLMVWSDLTEPPADILGQFISLTGTPTGNPFLIEQDAGVAEAGGLAFDGTNYLAVWESNGGDSNAVSSVHGRLISPAGTLLGSRIEISATSTAQKFPAVASSHHEFLVIWTEQSATTNAWSLFGRILGPDGTPGQGVSVSETPMQQPRPGAVASDGTNWLAVWNREAGPFPVGIPWPSNTFLPMLYGRVVAAEGTTPAPEFEIRRGGIGTFMPAAIFDGAHYLVAWLEQRLGPITGPPYRFEGRSWLFVGQLDAAGKPVATEMRAYYSVVTNATGLALGHAAGQTMLAWRYAHWPWTFGETLAPYAPDQPVLRNLKLLPTGASQFEIVKREGQYVGIQSSTNLLDWTLVVDELGIRTAGPGSYTTPTPVGGSGHHRFFRTIDGRTTCLENLRLINRAKARWALENWKMDTDYPATTELFGVGRYLPERPVCPMGGTYSLEPVEYFATCSFGASLGHTQ